MSDRVPTQLCVPILLILLALNLLLAAGTLYNLLQSGSISQPLTTLEMRMYLICFLPAPLYCLFTARHASVS